MSNCFLVADEVGLGKTIIAQHIAKGVFECEEQLRMIYVASNNRIARQNREDFLPVNFKEPKEFQKKTINRVMTAFYGENRGECKPLDPKIIENYDRISLYQRSDSKSNWEVMILSPKTSFYTENGTDYYGTENEKKLLKQNFECIEKILRVIKDSLKITEIDEKVLPSLICNNEGFFLLYSFWYEYNKITKDKYKIDKMKDFVKEITKLNLDLENSNFLFMRRVVSNVAFLKYKPNLLIMDEFQRFRKVLDSKDKDHYSLLHVLDFLKSFNKLIENNKDKKLEPVPLPKILLLSATPYKYDMSSIILGSNEVEIRNGENPFSSFGDLKECIRELGGNTDHICDYISRTERKMFICSEEGLFDTIYSEVNIKDHLSYLKSVYLAGPKEINTNNATEIIDKIIEHTPHFWAYDDVQEGYNRPMGTKIEFENDKVLEDVMKHAKMQSVKKYALPDGIEKYLWLPPASDYKTPIRKSLIFSKYKMTDKLIPHVINDKMNEMLSSPDIEQVCREDLFNCIKDILKEGNLKGERDKIVNWLTGYLSSDTAKKVISKAKGKYSIATIKDYCEEYKLKEVINEYLYCNSMQKNKSVFDYEFEPLFSCRYLEGDLTSKEQKDDTTKKQKMFNSPFYPFVMSVTETAQEGLDLHYYCDQIIHWSIPSNASAFLQREGRIDRPNSMVIRKRIQQMTKGKDYCYICRKQMICCTELDEQNEVAKNAGILPDWYIPSDEENPPRIRRIMCGTFLSGEREKDEKMLYASKNYNKFLDDEERKFLCPYKYIP